MGRFVSLRPKAKGVAGARTAPLTLRLFRHRDGARRAVPTEIGLRTNLIGPPDEIRRRLAEYAAAGVDELRVNPMGDTLDAQQDGLGQLLDLVRSG